MRSKRCTVVVKPPSKYKPVAVLVVVVVVVVVAAVVEHTINIFQELVPRFLQYQV